MGNIAKKADYFIIRLLLIWYVLAELRAFGNVLQLIFFIIAYVGYSAACVKKLFYE